MTIANYRRRVVRWGVVMAVAIGIAASIWFMSYSYQRMIVQRINDSRGYCVYESESYLDSSHGVAPQKKCGPRWLRAIFGIDAVESVVEVGFASPSHGPSDLSLLQDIAKLSSLRRIDVGASDFDDHGLETLRSCKSLERLDVSNTLVTKKGVDAFRVARPDVQLLDEVPFDRHGNPKHASP